ncbi:MAG TPA: serine protease [Candidatus Limnocylindrales bacterium]|jgi:S1-C subfamily serine protease
MRRIVGLVVLASLVIGCSNGVVPITPTPSAPGPTGTPGVTASPGQPSQPTTPSGLATLIAATVQIYMYESGTSGPRAIGSGSGTIISPDGLILTNAHVAAPDAPGLAVQYGAIGGLGGPLAELVVLMTEREDAPPVARFKASVVAVDGYLDVAVIRLTTTMDGQPVGELNLPSVALGDSGALHIGDPLTVVGFPGIGGDTVSYSTGDVSGFLDDPKIGQRGWIKTSALVTHGNSGGLAANQAGQIVGVPSRAPYTTNDPNDVGGYSLVRPISLAQPVIDAARNGQDYGDSRYVEAGTSNEQVRFVGWLRDGTGGCQPSNIVEGYASGVSSLVAAVEYSGFTAGEDFGYAWLGKAEGTQDVQRLYQETDVWQGATAGDCLKVSLSRRTAFPDGDYAMAMGIGPRLRLVATPEVTVGGTSGGPVEPGADWVLLDGRVIDVTTGVGISGAYVVVFKAGVDPVAWFDANTADDTQVLAITQTEADGTFVLNSLLPPSTELPVAIVAAGYSRWIGTLTTGTQSGTLPDVGLAPATP